MNFRKLTAKEIECRVGNSNKGKTGFSLLLYKDARCDMNILDETLGAEYWQRDHKELKGVLYCGVSIWNKDIGQWITKWDAGTESNTEKQKGEASDSFKRACFNLGIGRELYTSPFIWIKTADYDKDKYKRFRVDYISYDESGHINGLSISDGYAEVFKMGKATNAAPTMSKSDVISAIGKCTTIDQLRALKAKEPTLMGDIDVVEVAKAKQLEINNGF